MGKSNWYLNKKFEGKNISYAYYNMVSKNYLFITKRKLYGENLWYLDYPNENWRLISLVGAKHPQEPYYSGKEALNVAKKFMRANPNG